MDMEWNDFLNRFVQQPLFHSSMLAVFPEPVSHVQVQLSRWTRTGKLLQVRRGWYLIAKPWRSQEVPLSVVANQVVFPSYLSTEWALQYYDMIPEYVPNPTSITTGKGMRFVALETWFIYYHVPPSFFKGYSQEQLGSDKIAIACPEKALLDKMYLFLQRNLFSMAWLQELRLQQLEIFDLCRFTELAQSVNTKKFQAAVAQTCEYIKTLKGETG